MWDCTLTATVRRFSSPFATRNFSFCWTLTDLALASHQPANLVPISGPTLQNVPWPTAQRLGEFAPSALFCDTASPLTRRLPSGSETGYKATAGVCTAIECAIGKYLDGNGTSQTGLVSFALCPELILSLNC